MVDCALVKKKKQYEVAAKLNVHIQTVRKWAKRFKEEGESGLDDRSSRPNNLPMRLLQKRGKDYHHEEGREDDW